MQCLNCATELLHPANFCPVCGARLSAPPPDGTAATIPGGTPPSVVQLPGQPVESDENVVYLNDDASRGRGNVPANPHAADYATDPLPTPLHSVPERQQADELRRRAAELQAALDAFGSHGPVPMPGELVPPPQVETNPFGDFFGDGPTAWLVDEDDEEQVPLDTPRLFGTALASGALVMLLLGWAWWGRGMWIGRGGGAEAGGFLLVSLLLWAWYVSLPRRKQHAAMLRWHQRMQHVVERRTEPLRERTEGQMMRRRERDRYRAMAAERDRRIASLGEGAYRRFRQGTLAPELHAEAQRVLGIERQMIAQDQRIHELEREHRGDAGSDGHERTQPATTDGQHGHDAN